MKKALLLLVVLAGFVAGCENKYRDPDPQVMGYDYYPIKVGDYRIYDVTDTRFQFNQDETSRFQLRERVDTSFYDQTNQLVYKIIRSVRPDETRPWVDDSVMIVAKTEKMVLLTKDNTKYVKLVFPVKEGGEWIGDLYNTRMAEGNRDSKIRDGKEVYTYVNVGAPYSVAGKEYDQTIKIEQSPSILNTTRLDERHEVYATGIGLVFRIFNRVAYSPCSNDDCKDGPDFKLDGHERQEILVEYGTM